jgi:NAD-dependent deacetylase
MENIEKVKDFLINCKRLLVLTGAGVSKESGIPTFRGKDGLWRNFDATQLATPYAFERDPLLVWEWYNWRREIILKATPNAAHYGIKKLEDIISDFLLVTQNVDDLHREAGSEKLLEIHGNIFRTKCSRCGIKKFEKRVYKKSELPPKCEKCGSILRPDVVWFGEPIPGDILENIYNFLNKRPDVLVVGTSALVYPAAYIPYIAKEKGGKIVEINPDITPLSDIADISIREKAGVFFKNLNL